MALGIGLNQAAADTVTFSEANLAADGSNLDNTGTILEAANFSANPAASSATYTLNGIDFVGKAYASSASGTYWAMSGNNLEGAGKTSGLTSTDPAYDLVYRAWWSGSDRTLALSNLTPGATYRLQVIWTSDGNRDARLTNNEEAANTSNTQWYGPGRGGPGLITATWTETATSQSFTIERDSQAAVIAGLVISVTAIPRDGTRVIVH